MLEDIEETPIGTIGNAYGGLWIKRSRETCYWAIQDWSGFGWEEIPSDLFDELMKEKMNE